MRILKPVIDAAIAEYRQNIQIWLTENMVATDLIVLCGGNAEYSYDFLKPFLERYAEDVPGVGHLIKKHIGSTSIPQSLIDTGIASRYLDIYCLWNELNSNYKVEKDLVTTV